jgi:hypothetical protein
MPDIKDAIFNLSYKRFGSVAEIITKKLLGAELSTDNTYDLVLNGARVECKFARAQKEAKIKVTEENIMEAIFSDVNREVPYDTCEDYKWDCNFQQIKKDLFDVLYYGIFFSDCVVVYCIDSADINENINYSNKQHRGNVGEGQFHIHQRNIGLHDKYLYNILSYEELTECLKSH